MIKKIKNIYFKITEPIAWHLGYVSKRSPKRVSVDSGSFQKNNLLSLLFNNLKNNNFNPKHIVDIGANHGTWTREALRYFPEAYYTLIEPQYWLKDSISDILSQNPKIEFCPFGVGSQSGILDFTIADRDDSCTFIYTSEEASKLGYKQIEIPIKTLNELLVYSNKPIPDIIKIDAEGLDLEVLKGASDFIGKTEVIILEAGVFCKTIPNDVLTVLKYMDEKNYRLFEITDLNRPFSPSFLWLTELVFIKKNGFLDSKVIS